MRAGVWGKPLLPNASYISLMFMMDESCKGDDGKETQYGECGSFEHLLFLLSLLIDTFARSECTRFRLFNGGSVISFPHVSIKEQVNSL